MAQSSTENVVAHWAKLFEDFETSPKGFYEAVEATIERRRIPGVKTSRVRWAEGGLMSPDREYLRVSGDRYTFDICAAPFGNGFFFSSWAAKKQARLVLLYVLGLFAATMVLAQVIQWTMQGLYRLPYVYMLFWVVGNPFVRFPLASLVTLWLVAGMARAGTNGAELAIQRVPLIGWLYTWMFAPGTYYRLDTMAMFNSSVQAAMLEAIDTLTKQKGMKALSEDERKPIFHKLL